jgi:hypothetical protein
MTDTPEPLRLWPDNPTAVDLLGFADIAAPVLEAIARERLDHRSRSASSGTGARARPPYWRSSTRRSQRSLERSLSLPDLGSTTRRSTPVRP